MHSIRVHTHSRSCTIFRITHTLAVRSCVRARVYVRARAHVESVVGELDSSLS